MSYEQAWNETYGLDRDPIRENLVFPRIMAHHADLAAARILDIGCGNGTLAYHLLATPFTEYLGLDCSTAFLDYARANIHDHRIRFQEHDISLPLPVASATYSHAFCIFVLHELMELAPVFANVRLALQSNGKFTVVCLHPYRATALYLYEKHTGRPNGKLESTGEYFSRFSTRQRFTIAAATSPYIHHTVAEILNALCAQDFRLEEIDEFTVEPSVLTQHPMYEDIKDIPQFLLLYLST